MTWMTWVLIACSGGEGEGEGDVARKPEPDPVLGPFDRDEDGAKSDVDCDDGDPTRAPGAAEVCDGVDNDCDLEVDDDPIDGVPGYADADGDGHADVTPAIVACALSPALADHGDDCDDTNPEVHPGGVEVCNGADDDCDPATSEAHTVAIGAVRYESVADAVAAAVDGDTITVCDGTYFGSLSLPPSTLTIASVNGAAATVLDALGGGPVILASGGTLTLRGLTLTNGAAGGTHLGGGISASQQVLVVEDCALTANLNDAGGAIGLDRGSLTVRRTAFADNASTAEPFGEGSGGAIAVIDTTLVVEDSTFTDNRAAGFGGAISAESGASSTVSRSTFERNESQWGGALFLRTAASTLTDSTFLANAVVTSNYMAGGGAVSLVGHAVMTDCVFEDNSSRLDGGAVEHLRGDLTLERVTFTHNWSAYDGGAIVLYDSGNVDVIDSTFHDNEADEGGGGGIDMNNSIGTTLVSTGSDWGTGASDNRPADVAVGFEGYRWSLQDFTCTSNPRGCQ